MREYLLCLAFGLGLAVLLALADRVFDLSSGLDMHAGAGLARIAVGRL